MKASPVFRQSIPNNLFTFFLWKAELFCKKNPESRQKINILSKTVLMWKNFIHFYLYSHSYIITIKPELFKCGQFHTPTLAFSCLIYLCTPFIKRKIKYTKVQDQIQHHCNNFLKHWQPGIQMGDLYGPFEPRLMNFRTRWINTYMCLKSTTF